jgi:hypothetical protein
MDLKPDPEKLNLIHLNTPKIVRIVNQTGMDRSNAAMSRTALSISFIGFSPE